MSTQPAENPPARRGLSAVAVVLLGLGFLPLALAYFAELWSAPWYRWFPLALAGATALAVRGILEPRQPAVPGRPAVWLPLVGAGLLLLAAAAWVGSPRLGWLAALVALAGTLGWCGGWALFKRLLPAWVMLFSVLSPPLNWDGALFERLEKLVLGSADRLLFSLNVPHLISPVGVSLADLTIPRAGLFTGLYGLPGVVAAGLLWLLWQRRHPVRLAFTLGVAALFPLPGEVVRVAWGLAACDASGANFFTTPLATWIVLGCWLLYFGLLLSADQLLRFLTAPRRRPDLPPLTADDAVWPGATAALGLRGPASGLAWGLAAVALLLGGAGAGLAWQSARPPAGSPAGVTPGFKADVSFTLPDWPEWRNYSRSNSLAQVESLDPARGTWYRQRNDLALAISIEGPLSHPTTPVPLYQAQGWSLTGWVPVIAAGGGPPPCATAELLRDQLFRGVLWFGLVDETGRWCEPPGRLQPRSAGPPPGRPCYGIQVLAVSVRNLTPAERTEVRERFEAARRELSRQLALPQEPRP